MTNKRKPKVAMICSGGATKGIVHIGVLRAMQEIGVEVDMWIGASVGAIVSAFASQGMKAEEMIDWLRPRRKQHDPLRALRPGHFLGAPTFSQFKQLGWLSSGLLSIDPLEEFIRNEIRVNDFRKLDKTVLITATDIDGKGRVVFGKGYEDHVPISQAVAASSCVPLLYRPYRIGQRYFMDGELVKTLSIDLAIESGADVVVLSNVYRPHVTQKNEAPLVHGGPAAILRQTVNVVLSEKEKRGIDLMHRMHPNVKILNVSADIGHASFFNPRGAYGLISQGYRESLMVLAHAKEAGTFDPIAKAHPRSTSN